MLKALGTISIAFIMFLAMYFALDRHLDARDDYQQQLQEGKL